MRRTLTALAFLGLMVSAAAAQVTKDEIVKLAKAGISDDVIIAKIDQDKPVFNLSADDIADLKKQGVSEKVIQRMLECAPPAAAPPAGAKEGEPPAPPEPAPGQEEKPAPLKAAPPVGTSVAISNSSHVAVCVSLDAKEKIFHVSRHQGTDLPVGGSVTWNLTEGDWRIAIEGGVTIDSFNVSEGKATTLEFRGADTEYIDLVTLICEDKNGRVVSIISSVGRLTEGQRRKDPGIRPPGQYEGMYGPRFVYLPYVSNNVLLGAGVGAIIGHQSGHRTQGALIGAAAGVVLDSMNWRIGPVW